MSRERQPDYGFDDRRRLRLLGRAIATVLAAGVLAFLIRGANRPANPRLGPRSAPRVVGTGAARVPVSPAR